MADCCSRDCCSWFCGLCCCCCCGNRSKKETSPLLHSRPVSEGEEVMSGLQITPSADGQSETQKVEVTVHSHDNNEEDEEVPITLSSPSRDSQQSREASHDPPARDPATSTTFVRGSSGRSSWRMTPAKRQSQISTKEEIPEKTAAAATGQESEVKEVKLDLAATETPPPPPKDYRLTQSFEDDQSEAQEGGEQAEGIVHTSSFSFAARDGRLIGTQTH